MTSPFPRPASPEWLVVSGPATPRGMWQGPSGLTRAPTGGDSPAAAGLGPTRPHLGPVAGTCLWGKVPGTCWASLEWKLAPRVTWALCPARVRGWIPGPAGLEPEVTGFPRSRAQPRNLSEGRAADSPTVGRWAWGSAERHVAEGLGGKARLLSSVRRPAFFSLLRKRWSREAVYRAELSKGTRHYPRPKCWLITPSRDWVLKAQKLPVPTDWRWILRFFDINLFRGLSFPFNSRGEHSKRILLFQDGYEWCLCGTNINVHRTKNFRNCSLSYLKTQVTLLIHWHLHFKKRK